MCRGASGTPTPHCVHGGGGGDRAPPQGDFGGTPRFWGSGVAGLCSQQRVLLPQRPAVAEDPVEAGGGLRARLPLDLGVTALGGCDLNGGGGHKMGAGGTKWGAKRLGDKQDYKELGKVTKNWGSQRDVGRSEQLINSPGGGPPGTPQSSSPPHYILPPPNPHLFLQVPDLPLDGPSVFNGLDQLGTVLGDKKEGFWDPPKNLQVPPILPAPPPPKPSHRPPQLPITSCRAARYL